MTTGHAYERYRLSGLQWIPEIPEHWRVVPSWAITRQVRRPPLAGEGVVTAFRDGQVTLRAKRRIDGFTEAIHEHGYQSVRRGELVIHSMDGFAGAIGVSDSDGKMSPVAHIYSVRDGEPRYFALLLRVMALGGFVESLAKGIRERSTAFDRATFKSLALPVPPIGEQREILAYLDRETAQIDAFIAKNEELIALLTERRAAVIREATSVGTDATAELVDSGLDDVGMIPTGWRVMRLSWLFRSTGSGTTPPSELMLDGEDADVWWVTTGELRERTIESTSRGVSADTLAATSALKIHPAGSLLIAMYGATIGRMGVLGVPAASNQAVCALSGPVDCLADFVEYAMLAGRERLLLEAVGGGQPNINQETVRAFRTPVPPLAEQQQIVQHLRARVGDIGRAIGNAERGIELARERRAALISAAVTGRIDVREAA